MRLLNSAVITFAFVFLSGACAQSQGQSPSGKSDVSPAASRTAPSSGADRYYIDFRVAEIGAYGHSYVAFGRLDAGGKPANAHYADLHPMGNYLIMAIGHLVPVPANTDWDPDVLKLPVSSSYFRTLNAAQYKKLEAALREARANKQPYWNALTNNCNHFVAQLARAIGLRAPTDLKLSYAFVPALRELNQSASNATPPALHRKPAVESKPVGSTAPPL
jgi:hypothetical protein